MDDEFARNMKENLKSGRTARRNQEKIKEVLKEINELIEHYKKNVNVLTQQPINDLEKIKKILEG
jgi:uncharacterized FlaG/YvyC family protein